MSARPDPWCRAHACGWLLAALASVGCSNRPAWLAPSSPPLVAPTPVGQAAAPVVAAAPAAIPLPSYADPALAGARAAEERSRAEVRLLQDEVAALREQLAATSTQLAATRATARPLAADAAVPEPSPGAAQLAAALPRLSVPQGTVRADGDVIRIDLPADALFEARSAGLLPAGATLLTAAAAEIERVCPGNFVGIEGHTDNEPLPAGPRGSAHQLAASRAAAVFDFLTERTALSERQLFIVAHGPNHPVVSNATAAGRTRNRRIELVIYPEKAPAGDGTAATP